MQTCFGSAVKQILLGALAGMSIGAQAEIYRSVDANGRTVFTDKPSSGDARPASGAPSGASPAGKAGTDWQEQERAFRIRNMDRSAKEQRDKSESDKLCAQARNRDARLSRADGIVLYRYDNKGERVFISDQEREQMAEQARSSISQHCRR